MLVQAYKLRMGRTRVWTPRCALATGTYINAQWHRAILIIIMYLSCKYGHQALPLLML